MLMSCTHLAKLSHITNPLAPQRTEVGCDPAVLEVDDTSKRLIKKRSDGQDREAASFGLQRCHSRFIKVSDPKRFRYAYGEGVDHGLEAEIHLLGANDFRDILIGVNDCYLGLNSSEIDAYTWVIWLKQSNTNALFFEELLCLSKVNRSVVWRAVPCSRLVSVLPPTLRSL